MVWNKYWTHDKCKKEALKYEYRTDFIKGSGGAYNASRRNGWLDNVCKHMLIKGNRFSRAIYAFEFSDNSVYVGLTYNYDERYNNHIKRTKVILNKLAKFKCEFIMFNEFMPENMAAKKEVLTIKEYKKNGWTILNKHKGGGLGSSRRKWTKENIIKSAKSCHSLKEFRDKFPGAIIPAHKLNIYKDCIDILGYAKKPTNFWTKELITKVALEYSSKKIFANKESGAYAAAKKMGIYTDITSHMKRPRVHNLYWTKELIISAAKECKTSSEFRHQYPGARNACRVFGIYKKISEYWQE